MASNEAITRRLATAMETPTEELSVYGHIVRAMQSGQPVRPKDGKRLGRSEALVSMAIKEMRTVGWDIASRPDPQGSNGSMIYYALRRPDGSVVTQRETGWLDNIPSGGIKRKGRATGKRPQGAGAGSKKKTHNPGQIRAGFAADVAKALVDAYPEPVSFPPGKRITQVMYLLRTNHGYVIETKGGGQWVLIDLPGGVPEARTNLPAVTDTNGSSKSTQWQRVQGDREQLARFQAFHRESPLIPALGTVVRVVMIAEDNGNAAVVLKDMNGHQWFAHMDASHEAGV